MIKQLHTAIKISALLLTATAFPIYGHNKDKEFYIQTGYNSALSGGEIGIGGFIHGFNIEGNFLAALSESERIYWNDHSGTSMPFAATYRPFGCNLKVGYSIRLGKRFRITPQIGMQYMTLKETPAETGIADDDIWPSPCDKAADNSNALSGSAGVRVSFSILKNVGISVSPQYILKVSQTEGFRDLSEVSDKIKKSGEGFGCSINLNVSF